MFPLCFLSVSLFGYSVGINASWATSEILPSQSIAPEHFGAKGDGVQDDTQALNQALAASAAQKVPFLAKPGAVYRVSASGAKAFVNPTGQTIRKSFCVEVPSGTDADWRGSRIKCPEGAPVAVCNKNTSTSGDIVKMANLTVEEGGSPVKGRAVPLVWFWGLTQSSLTAITVQNTTYVGGVVANCRDTSLSGIKAQKIRGQGWHIGGNTSDRCTNLSIGTLSAQDIDTFGTANQPGNGFFIGVQNTRIQRITTKNCAGGIKFGSNTKDVVVDLVEFDGRTTPGQAAYASDNSGLKIQADRAEEKADRIKIGQVIARGCTGSGLFIRNAGTVEIGAYVGSRNGMNGTSFDLDIVSADAVTIRKVTSSGAGWGALQVRDAVFRYTFDDLSIRDCASVKSKGSIAVYLGGSSGKIESLTVRDTRPSPRISRVLESSARASGTIQTLRSVLKQPLIRVNGPMKIVRQVAEGK